MTSTRTGAGNYRRTKTPMSTLPKTEAQIASEARMEAAQAILAQRAAAQRLGAARIGATA